MEGATVGAAVEGDCGGDKFGAAALDCFVGELFGLEDADCNGDTVGSVLGCFVCELLAGFTEGECDGDTTTRLAEGEIDGAAFGLVEEEVETEKKLALHRSARLVDGDIVGDMVGLEDGWFDAS